MPAATMALDLAETLALALQKDVSNLQAKAIWKQHQFDDKIALSALLPQSSGSFENTKYHTNSANTATYRYEKQSLSLSQILFDPEKIARYTEATIEKQMQWLSYQQHEQNFIVYVAGLYFDLLQSIDNLSFAKTELSEYQLRYQQAIEQEKSGIITHTEALQVLAQMARSEASVIAAERTLRDNQDKLSQSIGQKPLQVKMLDEEIIHHKKLPTIDTWVAQAQDSNIDTKIAQKQIDLMQTAKNAALASFLPTVSAGFSLTRTQNYPYNGFSMNKTNQRSLSLSVETPFVTGGKRAFLVAKSYRTLNTAKIDGRKTKQDVQLKLRELYYSMKATEEFIQAEKKAVMADKELLKMNRIRHDVGAITLVEILDSISRLRQNQQALAKARYGYLLNLLQLKALVGTIQASDIKAIDQILTIDKTIEQITYDH